VDFRFRDEFARDCPLQRGVCCEPDALDQVSRLAAAYNRGLLTSFSQWAVLRLPASGNLQGDSDKLIAGGACGGIASDEQRPTSHSRQRPETGGETYEIGGPQIYSFKALLFRRRLMLLS
jgi:hypothetical protein